MIALRIEMKTYKLTHNLNWVTFDTPKSNLELRHGQGGVTISGFFRFIAVLDHFESIPIFCKK